MTENRLEVPVTLGTSLKDARQFMTMKDIEEYLRQTPGAKEILKDKDHKKPYFEYTVKTAKKPEVEDLNIFFKLKEVQKLVTEICCESDKIRYAYLVHETNIMDYYTSTVRIIVNGCNTSDFTKLKKIAPKGFNTDIYNTNQIIEIQNWKKLEGVPLSDVLVHVIDDWLSFEQIKNTTEPSKDDFEEFEKTHCKILNPLCFLREHNNSIQILNKSELMTMYENMEPINKKPFISCWLHFADMRTYNNMDMLPFPCGVPEYTYNLWKGWDVPQHEGGKANKFFDHIRNLIPDRTESQWFIVWLAHIFQKPGKKTGICPVLVGGQGSGKGFLIEQMIGNLMGNKFYHTNDPKNDLFERFCEGRNGKMLVNIDDFNVGILKLNNDPFKSLITGERITYEPKGKAKISSFNCSNFIITTNNSEPVKIETDDRRYALLGCSNKLVNNHEYFDRLSKYWEKPENRWAVFDSLSDIDITQIDLKKDRPINAMYNEMKTLSADKELLFLGQLINDNKVEHKNLYQTFTEWIRTNGFVGYTPRNSISFGKYILKIDGVTSRQSNGTVYIFDHKVVGEYLTKKGVKVDGVCQLVDDDY